VHSCLSTHVHRSSLHAFPTRRSSDLEFARIEARRLLETGEPEEYFAAMVDVTREYLAARVPGVRRSDTTRELLRRMQPREGVERSEEHTSELQSPDHLVCRLLLEKKK